MRKVALGVLLAAGVGFSTAPAHAQSFWFGIGPVGFGVGATPYAYGYDGYWDARYRPYGYYADPSYAYEPGYAYEPYAAYSYAPEYSYAPDYTYRTTYSYAPGLGYGSYAYEPRSSVGGIYTTRHHRSDRYILVRTEQRHQDRTRFVSSPAMRAQASVPMRHVHNRHMDVRHEMH